jgi:hypothetical protein
MVAVDLVSFVCVMCVYNCVFLILLDVLPLGFVSIREEEFHLIAHIKRLSPRYYVVSEANQCRVISIMVRDR